MAIVYGLKVNLSVAMVGMLNHSAIKAAQQVEDGHIINKSASALLAPGEEECTGGLANSTVSCVLLSKRRIMDVGKKAATLKWDWADHRNIVSLGRVV